MKPTSPGATYSRQLTAHSQKNVDLVVVRGAKRYGFEVKRTTTPRLTRSMHSALTDLRLSSLTVIHAGPETFALAGRAQAVAFDRLTTDISPLH